MALTICLRPIAAIPAAFHPGPVLLPRARPNFSAAPPTLGIDGLGGGCQHAEPLALRSSWASPWPGAGPSSGHPQRRRPHRSGRRPRLPAERAPGCLSGLHGSPRNGCSSCLGLWAGSWPEAGPHSSHPPRRHLRLFGGQRRLPAEREPSGLHGAPRLLRLILPPSGPPFPPSSAFPIQLRCQPSP